MKVLLFLSLLLLLLLCVQLRIAETKCPLYKLTNDETNFNEVPKPKPAGSVCPSTNSCCTSAYNSLIQSKTDLFGPLYAEYTKPACVALLSSLSCAACSPDSNKFFSVRKDETVFRVCKQFCKVLHEACAPAPGIVEADFCIETLEDISNGNWGKFSINIVDQSSYCFSSTPECTPDDYEVQASACVGGNRSLFYYWVANTTCIGDLPGVVSIGCEVSCDVGYFLSVATDPPDCKACPAGHYSLGGGVRIDTWKEWSSSLQVETYCTNDKKKPRVKVSKAHCAGWVFGGNGEYVSSGNTTHSASNVMEIIVKLVRPGYVTFVFRVDSEPYFDGLSFSVDGETRMSLTSNVLDFKEVKFDLTQGFHTLTWRYSKDFSQSEGEDRAVIKSVHVIGTQFADYECNACPPGAFNNKIGSGSCDPCPVNTFSNTTGSKVCQPCEQFTSSYPGSTSCSTRKVCTELDYELAPSVCEPNLKRTLTYRWSSAVCDPQSFPLPSPKTIDCTCPAGSIFKDDSCSPCPDGTIPSADGFACVDCAAGTSASKTLRLTDFFEWYYGLTTNCTGDCGSNRGWRLLGDSLDSGVEHGPSASSTLTLPVNMVQAGNLTLNFKLICEKCSLRIIVDNVSSFGFFCPQQVKSGVTTSAVVNLPEGNQMIRISFSKDDPHDKNRYDRAVIKSLEVFGSTKGGAEKCSPCPPGSYSSDRASVCSKCAAGHSSPGGGSACTPCPSGTFNPVVGGVCKPCGHGVRSDEGSLQCDTSCTYTSATSGKQYDLRLLKKTSGMYGPLRDQDGYFAYYVNLCQPPKTNSPCLDDEGKDAPNSISCVIFDDLEPRGYNLGTVLNFYDAPEGIQMIYDQGDECYNYDIEQRNSSIQFICDNAAGVGSPVLVSDTTDPCSTQFTWRSLYACPICSKADYYFTLTDCVGDKRQKIFFWRENPKRCHSGVELPAPQTIQCVAPSLNCPPGQYFDDDKCKATEPGYYSVGGGVAYNEWTNIPPPFTTDWTPRGAHIASRTFDSSLTMDAQLATSGEVSFVYRVWSYPSSNFTFKVDDRVLLKLSDYASQVYKDGFRWQEAKFTVEKGIHSFKWNFNSVKEPGFAAIRNITVLGTSSASSFQTLCPDGTVSLNRGSTFCQGCRSNTIPTNDRSSCANCLTGFYSFPMSTECIKREPCTEKDWITLRSACDPKDWRNQIYDVKAEPDICTGGVGPQERRTVDCSDCPPGFYRTSGNCIPCKSGWYHDTKKGCTEAALTPRGAAIKIVTYFTPESETDTWPTGWSTSCVSGYDNGLCITSGWRMRGSSIDSGFHANRETDVTVSLEIDLEVHGSVFFQVNRNGDTQNTGLSVFIDGKAQAFVYQETNPISIPLNRGKRVITWNYFQRSGASAIMTIKNVTVLGAANGGAHRLTPCPRGYFVKDPPTSCEPCPAGSYGSADAQSTCKVCPKDSFSPTEGSSSCIPCGNGTYTKGDNSTSCITTCVFTDIQKNIRFDLNPIREKVIELQGNSLKFSLSLCDPITAVSDKASKCVVPETGETVDGYVCGQVLDASKGNPYFNGGRVLEFEPSTDRNYSSFSLVYSMGSAPQCKEQNSLVRLHFTCETQLAPDEDPQVTKVEVLPNCVSEAHIGTRSACGFCTDSDYHALRTPCVDGRRNVSFVKLMDNCLGDLVKNSTLQSCSVDDDDNYHIPLVVFLVVLGTVLCLLILNIIFWCRNRYLKNEYSKLTSNVDKNEDLLNR